MEADAPSPPRPTRIQARNDVELPKFAFRVNFATATEKGRARQTNQDVALCAPDVAAFGVADGLGGHAAGDVAARIAVKAVSEHLGSPDAEKSIKQLHDDPNIETLRDARHLVAQAVHAAHKAVCSEAQEDPEKRDMGTTLDVVLLVRDLAIVGHVGDSRVYLIRSTVTTQVTSDHKTYDGMSSSTGRTPPAGATGPLSNSIGQRKSLRVDTAVARLRTGDRLVIGTDGAFADIPSENELETTTRVNDPSACCRLIINRSRNRGGFDDATLTIVDIGPEAIKLPTPDTVREQDLKTVEACPLLLGLDPEEQEKLIDAMIEVEFEEGDILPRRVTGDRVTYILLDGCVAFEDGRMLGASGMLHGESMVDLALRSPMPTATETSRALRLRLDDFNEIVARDSPMGAKLYFRLARHLCRKTQA